MKQRSGRVNNKAGLGGQEACGRSMQACSGCTPTRPSTLCYKAASWPPQQSHAFQLGRRSLEEQFFNPYIQGILAHMRPCKCQRGSSGRQVLSVCHFEGRSCKCAGDGSRSIRHSWCARARERKRFVPDNLPNHKCCTLESVKRATYLSLTLIDRTLVSTGKEGTPSGLC